MPAVATATTSWGSATAANPFASSPWSDPAVLLLYWSLCRFTRSLCLLLGVQIPNCPNFVQIVGSTYHTAGLTADGKVYTWVSVDHAADAFCSPVVLWLIARSRRATTRAATRWVTWTARARARRPHSSQS
jgi:hypothetical protein